MGFFFVSIGSAGIPWASTLLLALMLPFSGLSGAVWVVLRSGCAWGYGAWWSGWRGFETGFRRYDKIIDWNWGRYSFLIPASNVWTCTLVCLHQEDSKNQYRVTVILGLGGGGKGKL